MRKLRACAVLAAALPSLAAAQSFQPGKSTTDHYIKGDIDVTRGAFAGNPAWRLVFPADSFVLTVLGPAKTWNDARAACRLLAPRGAWDLPEIMDALFAADIGLIEPVDGRGDDAQYAAWLTGDQGEVKRMQGTDSIVGFGIHGSSALVLLGEFNAKLDQRLASPGLSAGERAHFQRLKKALSGGVPVRCVSRSVR